MNVRRSDSKDHMTREQRRRKLLAEGALYRFGIIEARAQVHANLNAPSLAKSVMGKISGLLGTGLGGLFSGAGSSTLQSLSPLLVSGLSMLSRRYLRKPLLYYGIIGAGVALARYLVRKTDTASAAKETPAAEGE